MSIVHCLREVNVPDEVIPIIFEKYDFFYKVCLKIIDEEISKKSDKSYENKMMEYIYRFPDTGLTSILNKILHGNILTIRTYHRNPFLAKLYYFILKTIALETKDKMYYYDFYNDKCKNISLEDGVKLIRKEIGKTIINPREKHFSFMPPPPDLTLFYFYQKLGKVLTKKTFSIDEKFIRNILKNPSHLLFTGEENILIHIFSKK